MATEEIIDQFENPGSWVEAAERFARTYWSEPRKIDRRTIVSLNPWEATFRVKDGLRLYRVKRMPETPWTISIVAPV